MAREKTKVVQGQAKVVQGFSPRQVEGQMAWDFLSPWAKRPCLAGRVLTR